MRTHLRLPHNSTQCDLSTLPSQSDRERPSFSSLPEIPISTLQMSPPVRIRHAFGWGLMIPNVLVLGRTEATNNQNWCHDSLVNTRTNEAHLVWRTLPRSTFYALSPPRSTVCSCLRETRAQLIWLLYEHLLEVEDFPERCHWEREPADSARWTERSLPAGENDLHSKRYTAITPCTAICCR